MPNDPRPIYAAVCGCGDVLHSRQERAELRPMLTCDGSAPRILRYSPDEWTRVPGGELPTEFELVDVTVATADGPSVVEVAYHVDGPLPWGGWARPDASELPGVIAWRPRPLPAEEDES